MFLIFVGSAWSSMLNAKRAEAQRDPNPVNYSEPPRSCSFCHRNSEIITLSQVAACQFMDTVDSRKLKYGLRVI